MAKKGLKLSDVLSEFNKNLEKNAEFAEVEPDELEEEAVLEVPPEADDEDEVLTEAAREVTEADAQHKASVDVLKEIASNAAENEEVLLAKEASEFGRLFADAVYSELQGKAEADEFINKTAEDTYNSLLLDDITEEAYITTRLSTIEKQAYDATEDNLASLDPEVLEALALEEEEELTPEEEAELEEAAYEAAATEMAEEEEEELTPEEEAELEEAAYEAAAEEMEDEELTPEEEAELEEAAYEAAAEEMEDEELTPEEAAALEEALYAAYDATENALGQEEDVDE